MTYNNIIIFTDLDSCLLDHNKYSFTAAKPLLAKLKKNAIPLIINSSKTKKEIENIQKEMGLDSPYIIENGAAIVFNTLQPETQFNINTSTLEKLDNCMVEKFSIPREMLLSIANDIKEKYHFRYKGFSDMSLDQISGLTNLSMEDSLAASQRAFSEPLLWQDSQSNLSRFKNLLQKQQITLQQGGRFIHLGSQSSKGKAMQWLLEHWQPYRSTKKTVIALGDSMNDESMLNKSDYAIVIKNKSRRLKVEGKIKTLYSSLPGTAGWVETLTPLLEQLTQIEGKAHG